MIINRKDILRLLEQICDHAITKYKMLLFHWDAQAWNIYKSWWDDIIRSARLYKPLESMPAQVQAKAKMSNWFFNLIQVNKK